MARQDRTTAHGLDERSRGKLADAVKAGSSPADKDRSPVSGARCSWLTMAGRGFGKTRAGAERAGAEWVRSLARDPTARISLVAATLGEVRRVMIEDESCLLAIAPWGRRPKYEPSRRLLAWDSGVQATPFSAGEQESLRGGNTVKRDPD